MPKYHFSAWMKRHHIRITMEPLPPKPPEQYRRAELWEKQHYSITQKSFDPDLRDSDLSGQAYDVPSAFWSLLRYCEIHDEWNDFTLESIAELKEVFDGQ